jgi:CDP-glucose 4,6-dehydratase
MFNSVFKNKKVIVTGHTGFKGSWLTSWLLHLQADVYGISKDIPTTPSMYEELGLGEKITNFTEDIRNYSALRKIISGVEPDFIFHMAAQPIVATSYTDPLDTITSNVLGTTHVLEALRELNIQCSAVLITSDKCYDNVEWCWGYKETDALGGKDIYSGSKAAAEVIFKSYYHSFFKDKAKSKTSMATVRAGNVIGGGDWADYRIVPDCIRAWVKGDSVKIRSPKATRPWQHVLEPLSGYLAIAASLDTGIVENGSSYNFGPRSEFSTTVKQLLDDLNEYWHLDQEPSFLSENISEFHEAGLLKLNCDKALYDIKWHPTLEYDKLIEFTSLWYYSFYNENIDMYDYTMKQILEYEAIATSKKLSWTT